MRRSILLALIVLSLVAGLSWPHVAGRAGGSSGCGPAPVSIAEVPDLPEDAGLAERELRRIRGQLDALKDSRPYIDVDTGANLLYLRTGDSILLKMTCSTGSGGSLFDEASGRTWHFQTPPGVFRVESKLVEPWWRKPDWAFIEDSLAVPDDPGERLDPDMLGEYALGFGDGYFIHGTLYERLLGMSVTHGCVRVGSDDLELLYGMVTIGTRVYVY